MPESNDDRELKEAVVITAIPLTKAQLAEIKDSVNKITNNQFKLINRVDKSIVGGLYLKIGDKIIDTTLRTKIEKLKERLLS